MRFGKTRDRAGLVVSFHHRGGRGRFGHMPNISSVYSLRGLIMNSHEQSASEVSIASDCFRRPRSSISQPGIQSVSRSTKALAPARSSGFTVRRGVPRSSRKTMTAADKGGSGHQPWSRRKYPFKPNSPLAKQQTGKADLEAGDVRSRCAARARVLDDRFHESCHKRGIHLSFRAPMYAPGALR